MKKITVFNNDYFAYKNITAVLTTTPFGQYSFDNTLKIYAYNQKLSNILDHITINNLINDNTVSIVKDWNKGDVIIITIDIHTFNKPWELEGDQF